jgi:hypothetical protein
MVGTSNKSVPEMAIDVKCVQLRLGMQRSATMSYYQHAQGNVCLR